MKILFLTHPFPNFVVDLLLHGFRKLFNDEVIDFPRKDSIYHGDLVGFCPEGQINHPWFPQDGDRIDRSDIPRKILKRYFKYIISDSRIFPEIIKTFTQMPKGMIFVDGEDLPTPIPVGPYVICRRETNGSDFSIPLPMALPEEVFHWIGSYDGEPKRFSIGFLGSVFDTYNERRTLLEGIAARYPDCLFNLSPVPLPGEETPAGWLTRDQYYSKLQQCKIVLTIRGAGYDTFRFWENAACNAVHISQKMPLYIPNDFQHGRHIFRFSTLAELKNYIDPVLENKVECSQIIQESRSYLLKHHTTQARASYLLEKLRYAIP